ncbi:MAG: hypothetical protein Q8L14_18025 [Myxococcales bacterium]|nr:hypothetical protein [Myxococcales bacterium]
MRKRTLVGVALSLVVPAVVLGSQLIIPHTFAPGVPIDPANLNANFYAVTSAVNTRLDLYGNGSAGALTTSNTTNWALAADLPAGLNFQFTDFTVPAGTTFRVPSGTVIRTTGNFTNAGTIIVGTSSLGGVFKLNPSSETAYFAPPSPGISLGVPCIGEYKTSLGSTSLVHGGCGGTGVSLAAAANTVRPGVAGGGGGAPSRGGALWGATNGGAGGGTFVVIAGGAVTNSGTIEAKGVSFGFGEGGAGGGGGGIVVLAARKGVANRGTITVRGGDGAMSTSVNSAGGGGGGGFFLRVGGSTSNSGVLDFAGGAGGATSGTISGTTRMAGGGGGACGGSGGRGGLISNNTPMAAEAGASGYGILRNLDPTTVF